MKLLKRVIAISGAAALIAGGAAFSACANGEDDAKTFDNVITATADAGYKSADISGSFTATMTMTANGADVSQDITAAISGVRSLSSLSSDIKVVAEGPGISSSVQQGEGVAYVYAYMRDGAIFTASAEEEIKDSDIASTQFTVADMFADGDYRGEICQAFARIFSSHSTSEKASYDQIMAMLEMSAGKGDAEAVRLIHVIAES